MPSVSEQIYQASPLWAQQLMVAAYGWWWYKRRFGPTFHRLVEEFKGRDRWSAQQFHAYQENQLRQVFAAAWNSPYYSDLFKEAGITRGAQPFEALPRVPNLSKETLRTHARDLLTRNPVPKGTITFKSSGTTGTPTDIFYTPEFHSLELAVPEARNLNWSGIDYRERRVMFGVRKVCRFEQGTPPFWRFSPAENLAYASIYHLSPQFLPHYIQFLRSYKPGIVMGYPSALNTIATYALESGDMPAAAKAVFTTSETVSAEARKRIEAAFQCRVYDRYCAVEMCLFASQCEYGEYHVSPEVGIIEIVDSHGKQSPLGEMGQVLCTGLQNTLQPLIRYEIGDVARWAVDQYCQCGRAMPILEAVEGRFEDICYTPDGRQVLRFDTVFKGVNHLREAQVVQERLDFFRVYVLPSEGFSEKDVETIQANMLLHVGKVRTEVCPVDGIKRSSAGKFQAVVCKISQHERARIRECTYQSKLAPSCRE